MAARTNRALSTIFENAEFKDSDLSALIESDSPTYQRLEKMLSFYKTPSSASKQMVSSMKVSSLSGSVVDVTCPEERDFVFDISALLNLDEVCISVSFLFVY